MGGRREEEGNGVRKESGKKGWIEEWVAGGSQREKGKERVTG